MPSLKCVELYRVDWEGPTPSNDEHAVNVDELPMLLTSDQKADLDIEISHLPSITGVNMQECLIAHTAKERVESILDFQLICHLHSGTKCLHTWYKLLTICTRM